MKKKLLISNLVIFSIFNLIIYSSCKEKPNIKKDIQTEFFSSHFGDNDSEVVSKIASQGLELDYGEIGSDNVFYFKPSVGDTFTFGGCEWNELQIQSNDKHEFSWIRFYANAEDRKTALEVYEKALTIISDIYELTEDTITEKKYPHNYRIYKFSDSKRIIILQCSEVITSYEEHDDIKSKNIQNIELEYIDKTRVDYAMKIYLETYGENVDSNIDEKAKNEL